MGIKFNCPNGHKLNVKSFLSGKRAICPKCGTSLVVPSFKDAAEVGAGAEEPGASTADIETDSYNTVANVAAEPSAADPGLAPTTPTKWAPSDTNPVDAILEAPNAVWYVRPVTGGQFGPASADVLRGWLNEGRVGASSLVWRAGWPEWRAAASVFPELAGTAPSSGSQVVPAQVAPRGQSAANGPPKIGGSLPTGHVVQNIPSEEPPGSPAGRTTEMPPLAKSVRRRRRANDKRLYASAVLVVFSIILLIVLFIVIPRNDKPSDTPTQEADRPAEAFDEPEDQVGL